MIEKPNCQGNTKLMTPQLEKIYKAEKFIQHLICDELKKLIYNYTYYTRLKNIAKCNEPRLW